MRLRPYRRTEHRPTAQAARCAVARPRIIMMDRAILVVALFGSLLLLGLLGAGLNDAVVERVQEQRLQGVIGGLRTLLETDLRIGLPLPHDEPAQTLLEDAVTRTPMLDSIEIDSDGSVVLFDSDRALRGEPVPAAWREAARGRPAGWRGGSRG